MNRSVRFAETVVAALPAATAVQPVLPHRSAGFAVLKAPDIPAVLIELGYLTNAKDESEMATEAWRSRVARRHCRGNRRAFCRRTPALPARRRPIHETVRHSPVTFGVLWIPDRLRAEVE